jgi:uroporphyrinogen-III decarboxylase
MRDGSPEDIVAGLEECYRAAAPRYIVGAGCEIPAGTPAANLRAAKSFAWQHTVAELLD